MKTIPYGRQNINQDDIDEVIKVLNSDWLTQGPLLEEFEKQIAKQCKAQYAVAVSNATAALHLACLAIDLKPGEKLWTSPNTFVASSNCALYCGAEVDFIDIDFRTYNLSVAELEKKLTKGERPQVVMAVHFAGQSCDMEQLSNLSKRYHFKLIEDASHAIGGRYKGEPIGSCQFSEMTIFSFHPVKIFTTGEGGVITTNNKELYNKLRRLRSHGVTRDTQAMKNESQGEWYYEQIELGFNYRMTEIQATLGLSQLKRLDKFIRRRRELVKKYNEELKDQAFDLPWEDQTHSSAHHLYVIQLKLNELTKNRRQIFDELREQGIGVNVHYMPVYLQPYYQDKGFKKGLCPVAENYYERAITLPLYYDLSDENQNRIIATVKSTIK